MRFSRLLIMALTAFSMNVPNTSHAASVFVTGGLSASLDPLDFGDVTLFERSELTFELSPVLDNPDTFLDVWLSVDVSEFGVVSEDCVGSFDPCFVTVDFQPYTVGQFDGSVSATYGIGGPTGLVGLGGGSIPITGRGVAPVPIPAGLPLALTGLALLAGLRLRRKSAFLETTTRTKT